MTKIIGVYADSKNGMISQTNAYINFIGNFGIPRLITQFDDPIKIAEECDMLLMPGGPDVNPMRYNEIPAPETGRCNIQYEYLDSIMIDAFINLKKPIVGICRGFQSLNVHFGGTLFQDMTGHNQLSEGYSRTDTFDKLHASNGVVYDINTIHHQAVKKLGDNLEAIGYSPVISGCKSLIEKEFLPVIRIKKTNTYCFVEAFKHKSLPIVAFQYHPEEFNCEFAIKQINNILNI